MHILNNYVKISVKTRGYYLTFLFNNRYHIHKKNYSAWYCYIVIKSNIYQIKL